MATDADNPCSNFEQENQEFYQALVSGHQPAWECLYIKAYRSFIPYARQRSRISEDDALDILQEGLAEFAIKLKNGKYLYQGKPVTAYVFTVCRNRWVSFMKKHTMLKGETYVETAADDDDTQPGHDQPHPVSVFGRDDDPDEDEPAGEPGGRDAIWEDTEVDWEAVNRAFAEVGDDCRTMLHCFYVEEKSLGECGARIGLQENSAKVKRFRCAQRMKALYTQYKRD
ncbi:hypothetical protein GCM10023189_38390 [Nibrella saemangeumensis]|uniref:RNA polymerase sigma factor, sigma-70 family n=1 Tax=Nibrella saemangeumensis TaxID=1084526 RepID=A0ABP8N963_9BACT